MKKYTVTISLFVAGFAWSNAATLTSLTDIDALAASGTLGDSVTERSGDYVDSSVYAFVGNGAILNIPDPDLLSFVNGGSGFLTVAAWINPTVTTEEAVFSWGGQSNGVKFSLKNGAMQITTKGVKDTNSTLGGIGTDAWTLVAWTLNLSESGNSRVFVGSAPGNYSTVQAGNWNDPSPTTFAIGSGNSGSVRDGFDGLIADLRVFSSTELVNNSDIASVMPPAPVLIPEPTTFGLLAGLGALAFVGIRRRKKAKF